MINIYDSTGNVILSPLTGSDAERVEELMSQDYAQLAWQSDSGLTLPAGSYIMLGGERLTLLDPYEPEQKDEAEWSYRPKFQSRVMGWSKVPFFHYTYGADNAITAREPDWTLTDTPANFMASVCKAIKNETGETWTYEIAGDIIATTITLSFSSADILSGLGQIAGGYDTEWRADKFTNTLYLGKAQHGTAVTLQVDANVGVPSVTRNKEGYYNRFYIFGSTRNITQDYQGANVNGLVNKRLTLDPAVYPGGYIDIPRASGTPVFPKILTFDDIYPHSGLTVADLRPRLMYRLDTDGNKVQVGTDSAGNAVYDMYTIWYFQLPGFTLNDSTYSKDNPTGMLISGKALSVHFKSGALTGREFELIYHPKAENLHNSDGQDFYVKAGDYEIKFIEENGLIIPMQTGIVPATGDEVILFNIRMPQEYVATAYTELKEAALKEIADRYTSDLNNYTIKSNPVAFADSDPGLSIGQKVLYVNGDYSYETRVIKLVRKLDIPSEQEITIGSEKVKGNSETLKEEVVNANSNIDILTQLNQLTQSVVQAYQRTSQLMLDGLGKLGRMWEFDPDDPNVIYTKYNFYGKGWGSVLGKNPNAGTITAGATTLGGLNNVTELADSATAAAKVLVREAGSASWTLKNLSDIVGLDTAALATYLSNNGYATQQWVQLQGYLTEHQSLADYATKVWVEGKGYLTAITKAQVEAVLTGDITSHTHSQYLTSVLAAQTYQPKGDYALTSALNSAVSSLNTAIGKKLDAATFDDLFVKESDGKGGYRIRAKYAFYSNQYISCLGNNPGAGTSPGGGVDLDAVQEYLQQQGYATQSWVQQQGYVTALGTSGNYLTWTKNGTVNNITVPFSTYSNIAKWLNTGGGNIDANTINATSHLAFYGEIDSASSNVPVTAGWQNSLINIGLHSNNSAAQLYFSAGNSMFFRPSKTGAWRTILDSENYAGVLSGKYVTVDTEQTITGKKHFTSYETEMGSRVCSSGSFDSFATYPHYMWHVANQNWTKAVMDLSGHIHFVDGGASGFASYKSIKALAFVVAGGTSSQFLKADGSVDSNAYLTAHQSLDYINNLGYLTAVSGTTTMPSGLRLYSVYANGYPVSYGNLLRIGGGGSGELLCGWTADTSVGELYYRSKRDVSTTAWSGWARVLTSVNYSSVLDSRYVNVSGDTMTGALSIKTDTQPCLKLDSNTAGKEVFMYIYSGGAAKNAVGWNATHGAYIYNSPSAKYLGIKDNGTPHFQGNTLWHAGNHGPNSGLNADLLDGYHEGNFVRSWWTASPGYNCNTYSTRPLISFTYGNNAPFTGAFIDIVTNGYGFMLGTVYNSDAPLYYRRHGISNDGGMGAWQQLARIGDNVASATKLQTARSIWGQSFDGTGAVSGRWHLNGVWEGTLDIFDGSTYRAIQSYKNVPLCLNPVGNKVAIGKTSAAYALDVNGEILTNGWIRTSGAVGWYNQTYAGGWHMDNASWIKAWLKPVYIGHTAGEGANSFGVGLRCYHASHTSVEVQGGSYTMGLGCHSNGNWCWWRGTSSGKYYVMQYNGTTWSFTGVLKTSTGMYSDGYMSCLGQNTGSDMRLKHIIGDVTLSLDMIADAPAKLFRWRYGEFAGRLAVGSIAQYWQQWLSPVVSKRPDDYLQMDYGVTALTASICLARIVRDGLSEHERRILALETENKALKSKINELERRLAA